MSVSEKLKERNSNMCELCNEKEMNSEFIVSPKKGDEISEMVGICTTCEEALKKEDMGFHWRCVEGSIWSTEPAVQALSYRILNQYKNEDWAGNLMNTVDLDENTINWAMSAFEVPDVHKDAFGNILENGDTVVLTQALNVKGTNFTASKGTVVKKIKLVADNPEHIEGKVNEQTIVILTKFVKRG
jgi:protein PhnA